MTTATATPNVGRSRRTVVASAVVIVLAATVTWWFTHADERRVDAACDSYLNHRESLRAVLSETDEAAGRALAAKADRVEDQYFNDADEVRSWIDQWMRTSPDVIDSLDQDDKHASGLAHDAARSLTALAEGLAELQSLTEGSEPSGVADWLREVSARMQWVDDTCLSAARDTGL